MRKQFSGRIRPGWYERNQKRFETEILEMEKQFPDFKIEHRFRIGWNQLAFKGIMHLETGSKFFAVFFPENYPFQAPTLGFLKDLKDDKKFEKNEEEHENPFNFAPCLYPSDGGPHSWRYYYTAADALDKLKRYSTMEKKPEFYEHTSEEFDFPGIPGDGIVFVPSSLFSSLPINKPIELNLLKHPASNIFWLTNKDGEKSSIEGFDWDFLKQISFKKEKCVAFCINSESSEFKMQSYKQDNFWTFLQEQIPLKQDIEIEVAGKFLLLINKGRLCAMYSDLSATRGTDIQPNRVHFIRGRGVAIPESIFSRAQGIFTDSFDAIRSKKVLILGLGTIGSFIALELAKTGVGNFVLYDYDRLEPENICRHVGNLEDLGLEKTDLVRKHIKMVNPRAVVDPFTKNPVDGANITEFETQVRHSDLIIVTTANYESEMFTNEVCTRIKKPVIYSYCNDKVDFGEIFYYNPPDGPCYECLQSFREQDPRFKILQRPDSSKPIPGRSYYETPGIPGISIDINFISLFAAKLAVTALMSGDQQFHTYYSIFKPDDYFFYWQNRAKSTLNFGVNVIPIQKVHDCAFCSNPGWQRMLDSKGRQRLSKLARKYMGRDLSIE